MQIITEANILIEHLKDLTSVCLMKTSIVILYRTELPLLEGVPHALLAKIKINEGNLINLMEILDSDLSQVQRIMHLTCCVFLGTPGCSMRH